MINELKEIFYINGSYKASKRLAIIFFGLGILLFNILISNYYANADGLIEGLYFYKNADWATAGCGRFLIRYLNYISANNVIPIIKVTVYSACIYLTTLLINNLWGNKNELCLYLMGSVLISCPVVVSHMPFMYMATAFSFSCLFSTLFVYFNIKHKGLLGLILGIVCVVISLGLYQSYIGFSAALGIFVLFVLLLKNNKIKTIIDKLLQMLVSAILGCISYLLLYKLDLSIHHLVQVDRASQFSINNIISNLPKQIIYSYSSYIEFFCDTVLKRKYIYTVLFVIFVICFIKTIINLLKDRKSVQIVSLCILLALLPIASNLIALIIPSSPIYISMEHQNLILMMFILYLCFNYNQTKTIRIVTILSTVLLVWTYTISANATYRCYELSYNAINEQMREVVYDINHTEGYIKNETPIILIGFPSDEIIRSESPLYQFTINFPANPAFWLDMNGATNNRYQYFINYFGMNALTVSDEEYSYNTKREEIKEMNIYPNSDSIRIIDNYLIIKLSEIYPAGY